MVADGTNPILGYGTGHPRWRVTRRRLQHFVVLITIVLAATTAWRVYTYRQPNYAARYFGQYETTLNYLGDQLQSYANSHGGFPPPNLDALVQKGYVVLCPSVPKSQWVKQGDRWVVYIDRNSWNSYIYVADTFRPYSGSRSPVVLQELRWPHTGERWVYVLFEDGHAERLEPASALGLVAERTAQELEAAHPAWGSAAR